MSVGAEGLRAVSLLATAILICNHYFIKYLNLKFSSPNKQCDLDPIPTWILKICAPVLIPTITNTANFSLTSGHFHPILKSQSYHVSSKSLLLTKRNIPTTDLSLVSCYMQ